MLLAQANTPPGRRALFCLIPGAALFGLATLLHALKVVPFSPAVPSMQKVVIVSFMAWQLTAAVRISRKRARRGAGVQAADAAPTVSVQSSVVKHEAGKPAAL